jgi:hypothetical protein
MFTFAADYFIMVFVASLGVMQTAASIGGLRGLLVFKNPLVARLLGIAIAIAAIVWFFMVAERNINDYEGGLDAPTQGLFFFLGAFTAVLLTLALSSLVNHRMRGPETPPEAGIDTLRDTSYTLALARSITYWCRNWRTQTKRYFLG